MTCKHETCNYTHATHLSLSTAPSTEPPCSSTVPKYRLEVTATAASVPRGMEIWGMEISFGGDLQQQLFKISVCVFLFGFFLLRLTYAYENVKKPCDFNQV